MVKNLSANIGEVRDNPWVRKIPWRRKWQPTVVFLPGESHGQRSLVVYSPWVAKSWTRVRQLSTPGVLPRSLYIKFSVQLNDSSFLRKCNESSSWCPRNDFLFAMKSSFSRHSLFWASWHPLNWALVAELWFNFEEMPLPLRVCAEWGSLSLRPLTPELACDLGTANEKDWFSWPQGEVEWLDLSHHGW